MRARGARHAGVRGRVVLTIVALLALLLPTAQILHPSAAAAAPAPAPATGLTLRRIDRFDGPSGRHLNVEVHSGAMGRGMKFQVLLPRDYARTTKRYPVIYLGHGGGGDERRWAEYTRVEEYTEKLDLIVVIPAAGRVRTDEDHELGWYSDWFSNAPGTRWETYHLNELIPFVDAQFRTIASRSGRAFAGLSMGGYGALAYAARRPDLFAAVASFAGVTDLVLGDAGAGEKLAGKDVWGPYGEQEVRHRGHNPMDLVTNLRGVDVYLTSGAGADPDHPEHTRNNPAHMTAVEPALLAMNQAFSAALTEADIPHVYKVRSGNHSWPYWDLDLREWLPHVLKVLSGPSASVQPPAYRSAEPAFTIWGWSVKSGERPREFLQLEGLGRHGATVAGSGVVTLLTPRYYAAGQALRVKVGSGAARIIRAGAEGRLQIRIDLGIRHAHQQFTAAADAEQLQLGVDYFRTLTVVISKA